MWDHDLRRRAMLAAINVGNRCTGRMSAPTTVLPFHLGEIAGLLQNKRQDAENRRELRDTAKKLSDILDEVEDEEIKRWVEVTIDLAEAAARCTNQRARDHFLMVLAGVEAALEQNPPKRGLGKKKSGESKGSDG